MAGRDLPLAHLAVVVLVIITTLPVFTPQSYGLDPFLIVVIVSSNPPCSAQRNLPNRTVRW